MKHIVVALILILLIVPSASADLGIMDALSDVVCDGIGKFCMWLADMMYEVSFRPEGHEFNGTGTEVFIYAVTTHTADPWSDEGIQDFRKTTVLWFIIYCSLYSSVGFIYLACMLVVPDTADMIDETLNRSPAYQKIRIQGYFGSLAISIAVLGFTNIVIKMAFTLNYFIVSILLVSSMETHALTPSPDNIIVYVAMGLFYFIMSFVMLCREVLVNMFVMSSYIIGACLISTRTREYGKSLVYYYMGILFLQSSMVLLVTMGYISAKCICSTFGFVIGSVSEIIIYAIVLLIIIVFSFKQVLRFSRAKHTIMRVTRRWI